MLYMFENLGMLIKQDKRYAFVRFILSSHLITSTASTNFEGVVSFFIWYLKNRVIFEIKIIVNKLNLQSA